MKLAGIAYLRLSVPAIEFPKKLLPHLACFQSNRPVFEQPSDTPKGEMFTKGGKAKNVS